MLWQRRRASDVKSGRCESCSTNVQQTASGGSLRSDFDLAAVSTASRGSFLARYQATPSGRVGTQTGHMGVGIDKGH